MLWWVENLMVKSWFVLQVASVHSLSLCTEWPWGVLSEDLLATSFVDSRYRNVGLCFRERWNKKYFQFAPSEECCGDIEKSATACPFVKVLQVAALTVCFLWWGGFYLWVGVLTCPSPLSILQHWRQVAVTEEDDNSHIPLLNFKWLSRGYEWARGCFVGETWEACWQGTIWYLSGCHSVCPWYHLW